jgi:hypothetical protein
MAFEALGLLPADMPEMQEQFLPPWRAGMPKMQEQFSARPQWHDCQKRSSNFRPPTSLRSRRASAMFTDPL